jgi:hypothetical protein
MTPTILSLARLETVEPSEADWARLRKVTETQLSPQQLQEIAEPEVIFPLQRSVLAVHWHPEFIPMEVIASRIHRMFPNAEETLIIPTQHNELMEFGAYSGVEVDCYSHGFNQKVQLLLHFRTDQVQNAHTLRAMLEHTRRYRSSQLFDFIHAIVDQDSEILYLAARETGANSDLVHWIRRHVRTIQIMLEELHDELPQNSIKNKILRDYFDDLRGIEDEERIDLAQNFLNHVKRLVKERFPLQYFYRTSEIIEEARSLGAGIVIPHPEQFWPILLADYDVDGIETWNPQSQRYTPFLITAVGRTNQCLGLGKRRKLIFMGDDTHMGEKVKDKTKRHPEKSSREIGLQPAWEDLEISKRVILAGMSRENVIREYRERLNG